MPTCATPSVWLQGGILLHIYATIVGGARPFAPFSADQAFYLRHLPSPPLSLVIFVQTSLLLISGVPVHMFGIAKRLVTILAKLGVHV